MRIHISYLESYTRKLNQLSDELLNMQDKYEVTADINQVEELSETLERLKLIIETLPLA